jgi:hypothetical protein
VNKDLNESELENELNQSLPTWDTYLGIRIIDPLDPPGHKHTEYLSSDQGENGILADDIVTNNILTGGDNILTDSDMNYILTSFNYSTRHVVGGKSEER